MRYSELTREAERTTVDCNRARQRVSDYDLTYRKAKRAIEKISDYIDESSMGGPITYEHFLVKTINQHFLIESELMRNLLIMKCNHKDEVANLLNMEEDNFTRPYYDEMDVETENGYSTATIMTSSDDDDN